MSAMQIGAAVEELTSEAAAGLLLTILHNDIQAIVGRYIAEHGIDAEEI